MNVTAYHRPRSLDEAKQLLAEHPAARLIAGGTDLLVRLRAGRESAAALVSLRGVGELAQIEVSGEVRLGAGTILSDILAHRALAEVHPVLAAAARTLGSPQIRNVATVGGNLASARPCADLAPPLLVLDAVVLVDGPNGTRELPLDDFLVGPGQTCLLSGEILVGLRIPPPAGARAVFFKKGRVAMDLALVSVAASLALDRGLARRVRLAAGSVAPRPLRLRDAEAILEGKNITPALASEAATVAAAEIQPISDLRASADYRRELTLVFVRRAHMSFASEAA